MVSIMAPVNGKEAACIRIRISGLLVENNAVLLVNHVREGRSYYLLPGGGLEVGERIEDCLKREFLEECCLEIEPGAILFTGETIYPDGKRHILHMVFEVRRKKGSHGTEQVRPAGVDERVRSSEFVSLDSLRSLPLVPPFSSEIERVIHEGSAYRPRHLGVLWRDI